jgi:hypothetical protein
MDRPGLQVEAARHLKSLAGEPLGLVVAKECHNTADVVRSAGSNCARWEWAPLAGQLIVVRSYHSFVSPPFVTPPISQRNISKTRSKNHVSFALRTSS